MRLHRIRQQSHKRGANSVNLLHITDLKEGNIQVSWRIGNGIPRNYEKPIPFADPLNADDRKELRWYLEEYLNFPYGAERERAKKVEQRMAGWGEELFKRVFIKGDPGPDPRSFYQTAVQAGLEQCELCITSEDPAFLNIPWELMRDPTPGRGYLAPSLAGLYRQHVAQKIEDFPEMSPDQPFRILLVIARPYGKRDVALGTVSRPMLEALRPLRPRVQLDMLRPPTFDALVSRLNDQRGYYNLVHFDGHGVFATSSRGHSMQFAAMAEKGHLVFEREDGTPHVVNSQSLGEALATCKVPLFVLNACQSAEEGEADSFSSVASQLVAVGAKGVVAMSYSVYAETAAYFIERFYESLVNHNSLSEAVAAARQRLYTDPHRESVIGSLELRDWIVPALYQQEYRYVPIPEGAGTAAVEEKEEEVVLRKKAEEACPEGQFGFIGRDYDILEMERRLRDDNAPWVLLSGIGGTGKTELAFGFARWFAETGGCPGGVFMTSFKEKADFGQVVGSIVGYGTDFSSQLAEKQRQILIDHLRTNPCLLIWDNFEPVAGYPTGAEPLATDEERDELSSFLKALRGGKSRVIITTRKQDEGWLGIAYKLMELSGLTHRDAGQMAKVILSTVGREPEDFKDDPDYARLIRLLNGHPRSLEVVLPHLRRRSPTEIMGALQHYVDDLGEAMEDASLSYAFSQMSHRTRKHLPFIGLFASYVRADVLGVFVASGDERQKAYEGVMGETLDAQSWEAILEEAGRGGLLRPLGSKIYELHPTLPTFLRRELVSAVGEGGLVRLDWEFMKFYQAFASTSLDGVRNADRSAVVAVTIEEANLLRALRLAEMNEKWLIAGHIAQILGEFYEARGRMDEWDALRVRLLGSVGSEMSPDADRDRANLWMYLLGEEANRAMARNDLDAAEPYYHSILYYLISLDDPGIEPKSATVYHQLGNIVFERQDFDGAAVWYRKAMEIRERHGLERDTATDYHQLGIVAQEHQHFDAAEMWYKRALEIRERHGLERDAATDYHQLGRLAQDRHDFDQAQVWYKKALEIRERLGLERDASSDYHQLGNIAYLYQSFDLAEAWYRKALEICERMGWERDAAEAYDQLGAVAEGRQDLDGAEVWYRKALEIFERLGLERHTAIVCHQSGMVAQKRQDFDEAEVWYRKAMEIFGRLGLSRYSAGAYHQLGTIAEGRQDFDQAEVWYKKAMEILEQLGHPPLLVETLAQLGVLSRKQGQLRKAIVWSSRALSIATEYKMRVITQIMMDLARVMKAMGEEEFAAPWREAMPGQDSAIDVIRGLMERLN